MGSIVVYSDDMPHCDEYPNRIVSPTRSSKCCIVHMVKVGDEISEERVCGMWNREYTRMTYRYKVCSECGFAVKCIVKDVLSEKEIAGIQKTFGGEQLTKGWAWD